jgi:hypothetical protein
MGWTIRVSRCDIPALNDISESSYDLYEPLIPVEVGPVFYTRAATHRAIPATISISTASPLVRQVEVTTKIAKWSLYYKDITPGNKGVTFKDGTVFTVDGATLTVTSCIRGLNGTYTKSAEPVVDGNTVYSIAGSSTAPTDIPRSVSCDWGERVFSIGVDEEHTVDCGERAITKAGRNPVSMGVHASGPDSDRQPNALFAYTNTVEPECTTNSWHPFAKEVTVAYLPGNVVLVPRIMCHTNSIESKVVTTRECVKGRWRVPKGDDALQCKPGTAQRFINVSGFTRAEAIFNGAYEYQHDERASTTPWPSWTNTTNKLTRIEISETIANTLELRDTSSAVGYTIKIIKSTAQAANPTLDVYDMNTNPNKSVSNQTTNTTSSIISAVFSDKAVALSPCDQWSQCVEANGRNGDGAALALACGGKARACARPASATTGFDAIMWNTLVTSAGAMVIQLFAIVPGDIVGPMYGWGSGITSTATATTTTTIAAAATTLYVVIPSGVTDVTPIDGQKAKVLVIPPTGATAVRDATLAVNIVFQTWTIDAQVATAKPTEKPAAETAKPAAETAKPAAETAKPAAETAKPAAETAKPAEVVVPCADLLACLSLPASTSSLGFSACAARAVSCAAATAPTAVGAAARVLSGDKLMYNSGGVELYRLSTVLYGTDKDSAYVIVHGDLTKGRLLVAPLNNGTAIVVDVEKTGSLTAWTVVADNTPWIIGGIVGGLAIILVIVWAVFLRRKRVRAQYSQPV